MDFEFDNEEDEVMPSAQSPVNESGEENEDDQINTHEERNGDDHEGENENENVDDIMEQLFGSGDEAEEDYTESNGSKQSIQIPVVEGPNPASKLLYMKPGNTLQLEPTQYDGRVDENDTLNTIRWRYHQDPDTGETVRESNARLVRWSNGTVQLYIGNKPIDILETEDSGHLHLFVEVANGPSISHGRLPRRIVAQSHEQAREKLSKAMVSSRQQRDRRTKLTSRTEPELQDQLARATRVRRVRQRRVSNRVQEDMPMEDARGGRQRILDDEEGRARLQRARSGGVAVQRNDLTSFLEDGAEEDEFDYDLEDEE